MPIFNQTQCQDASETVDRSQWPAITGLAFILIFLYAVAVVANGYILIAALWTKIRRKTLFSRIDRIMLFMCGLMFIWVTSFYGLRLSAGKNGCTDDSDRNSFISAPICLIFIFYCSVCMALQRLFLIRRLQDFQTVRYFLYTALAFAIPTSLFIVSIAAPMPDITSNNLYATTLILTSMAVVVTIVSLYIRTYRESVALLRISLTAANRVQYRKATRQPRDASDVTLAQIVVVRDDNEDDDDEVDAVQLARQREALMEVARLRVETRMFWNTATMSATILVAYVPVIAHQIAKTWFNLTLDQDLWFSLVGNLFLALDAILTPLSIVYFNRDIRYICICRRNKE
ncbi:hypothetical protein BC830DRAFT_1149974 [Chytriomyces sp. MP71]|nr:hypothetical protein BC830DRAFT_1149974 [Chytriomyces sp. MP71]